MSHLKALAQRFVEDDLSAEDQQKLIIDAAEYVGSSQAQNGSNGTSAVELALSIQRWMSKDGSDDDHVGDVEKNAKAHTFVARTLKALPTNTLTAKEVQVFAGFFGSMYAIGGNSWPVATEALTTLTAMDNCSTSAGDSILSSMADIDPADFTKQLAKTRLDLFQLLGHLLSGGISEARQKRDSLPRILKLAARERDPNNLLHWFTTLSSIIRVTSLSGKISEALFESFSPFFPISIRASTTSSNLVSEQDLKNALRSCFAANGLLAQWTLPFLLGKLDDGTSSMTASVKLDILETIKACILGYEPFDTHVLPYIAQIWSSLKYEVRNGEAPEAIQGTLSVFESVSKRLAVDSSSASLGAFIDTIWTDSIGDLLDNPAYTERLGSILISVAGAHLASFRIISPKLSQAIQRAMEQPKTSAHTKSLLLVLNNLLRARRQLASRASAGPYADSPVSMIRGVFFKVFSENAVEDPNKQQFELAQEALLGLEQIVKQRRLREDGAGFTTDCDEEAFKEICATLSFRYLNCFNRRAPNRGSTQEGFEFAVGKSLLAAVQHYPQGYGKIVSDVVDDVKKTIWSGTPAKRSRKALTMSCMRLAYLGCSAVPEDAAAVVNFATFAGGMLKILGALFDSNASYAACTSVAVSILQGIRSFVNVDEVRLHLDALKKSDDSKKSWDLVTIDAAVRKVLPTFPDLATDHLDRFDPVSSTHLLSEAPRSGKQDFVIFFLQLSVFIVRQLYQHATTQVDGCESVQLDLSPPLTAALIDADGHVSSTSLLWRDRYLNMVASIAAAVLRELTLSAQKDLGLHTQMMACFRPFDESHSQLSWAYHRSAALGELSLGIVIAIRPEVVSNMSDHGALLAMDVEGSANFPPQMPSRIAIIVTLLANKYDTSMPKAIEEARQKHGGWIQILSKIEDSLKDPDLMANISIERLTIFTGILWGAISRGDRFVDKGLQDAIGRAAVKSNDAARLLARMFLPIDRFVLPTFTPAYLISKPLSGQRAYHHCVGPVLSHAYPVSKETEGSVSLAIYVLHSVKWLNVAQYEQDVDKILRLAVTAMTQSKCTEDLDAAAQIVHHIIQARTALARQYWSTILKAARSMYANAKPFQTATTPVAASPNNFWTRNAGIRPETEDDRTELRKKALRISALVAQKMDRIEPQSLEHSRALIVEELMHLTTASADKIREIRVIVLLTRAHWLRIQNSDFEGEHY